MPEFGSGTPSFYFTSAELWQRVFAVAFLQWALAALVCHAMLVWMLIVRREKALGVTLIAMTVLCFPGLPIGLLFGLIVGWARVNQWKTKWFMTTWTTSILMALLNAAAFAYFMWLS